MVGLSNPSTSCFELHWTLKQWLPPCLCQRSLSGTLPPPQPASMHWGPATVSAHLGPTWCGVCVCVCVCDVMCVCVCVCVCIRNTIVVTDNTGATALEPALWSSDNNVCSHHCKSITIVLSSPIKCQRGNRHAHLEARAAPTSYSIPV